MTKDQTQRNLRIFEAIAYEDALDAAERRELTPTERDEARSFVAAMRARVIEKQRADRKRARDVMRIRPSILAMTRDAMLRRLGALIEAHPSMVIAHRDLTELTDHDLRTALEDAEALIERVV